MNTIDYFYSAHSAFAYLGAQRLYQICAEHDVRLIHKPFELSPVVELQGSLPFRERTQRHVDYFFGREIERWAEWRAVPVVNFRPTYHDADYGLASRVIAAIGDAGADVDAMSLAILQAHWRDDADLSDRDALAGICSALGHDAQGLLEKAATPQIGAKIDANTDEAKALGVFGSPTYVVNGDMFYGQDRLELIERALEKPFAPSAWVNPPVN